MILIPWYFGFCNKPLICKSKPKWPPLAGENLIYHERGSSSKLISCQSQPISHQSSTNLILIILIAYFLHGKILLFVFPSLTMLEPGDLCLPSTNIRDTPPYWSVSSALYFLFCTKLYYRRSTRCCLNKCYMKGSAIFSGLRPFPAFVAPRIYLVFPPNCLHWFENMRMIRKVLPQCISYCVTRPGPG